MASRMASSLVRVIRRDCSAMTHGASLDCRVSGAGAGCLYSNEQAVPKTPRKGGAAGSGFLKLIQIRPSLFGTGTAEHIAGVGSS